MKNKFFYIFLSILISNFLCLEPSSAQQFNFDVTEIEILNNGKIIKGLKNGTVKTNNGVSIAASTFIYDKESNILTAEGNIEIIDSKNNLTIYSNNIVYDKNKEIITSKKNSKALYDIGKTIFADSFKYNRKNNIFNALGNVKIENTIDDYSITGNDFTYFKNSEKIITSGETKALIQSKYKITSSDIIYSINENNLTSKKKTKIEDMNSQVYLIENFNYQIDQELLKGDNILIITNYNLPKSDTIFFKSAIINLKETRFLAKDTTIEIHEDIFGNSNNNPRLKGVSSSSNEGITLINKGIFTSCKKNDNCPPWSIQANKIKHDKTKKQLVYNNAILKIYDFPVLYFPKFFHPDPSVKRQSGLLKPEINNSTILGSSFTLPYFKVLDQNKDLTITPTIFDNDILMTSIEYRKENKNSNIFADFGFVDGYKSASTNKKKNLSHLFFNYNLDLNLQNYNVSDLKLSLENVSNDQYLKIFDPHITKSDLRPNNFDLLNSSLKLFLNNENFNFESGIQSYENLQTKKKSDRFQYILPYYNLDKLISQNYFSGNFNFNSTGSNNLDNTNNLKTNITNNLNYNSLDFISNLGLKSNYGFTLQNLNSLGKKVSQYKSSPQIELAGLFNLDLSLPLSKNNDEYENLLIPKLSFRFNPSDMKNYSSSENKIDVNNIFAINRLGLSDTLETGRSVTLGVDFSKEKKDDLNDINNYFEIKLATVLRDKEEKFIPNKTSINNKSSNLFGSISNKLSNNLDLGYNFSIDNDYNTFVYNDFNATISVNNLVTTFNFIEENSNTEDTNIINSSITYNFDEKNLLKFETRRNRKINLTEYYDLVYEYKNDCLTAGIKYEKTYYSDGDLKPNENLLFTITLFPLTTYEYAASDFLKK